MTKTDKFLLVALAAFVLSLIAFQVLADGDVYTGGTRTINCTNPDSRTDGTPLSSDEIDVIRIYISDVDQSDTPQHTVIMAGGCTPSQFSMDALPEGQLYAYGQTIDTASRESGYSASVPFVLMRVGPEAPSGIVIQ